MMLKIFHGCPLAVDETEGCIYVHMFSCITRAGRRYWGLNNRILNFAAANDLKIRVVYYKNFQEAREISATTWLAEAQVDENLSKKLGVSLHLIPIDSPSFTIAPLSREKSEELKRSFLKERRK